MGNENRNTAECALASLVDSMKSIVSRIERGDMWEELDSSAPTVIYHLFTYPNGKNGDIDMYLSNRYGQVTQIDAIKFSAELSPKHKEKILLLAYAYSQSSDNGQINELNQFLCNYNLGHKLRKYCDDYLKLGGDTLSYNTSDDDMLRFLQIRYSKEEKEKIAWRLNCARIRSNAMEISNRYIDRVRKERNAVYSEIVKQGLSSARWTSEQKAYLIVKNLHEDTIFQYHAEWLGHQSLDIFIPSMNVGIEYQGKQHFEAVNIFGGDDGLQLIQSRDKAKKQKCIDNGVRLIEWRYDAPLTEEYIQSRILEIDN